MAKYVSSFSEVLRQKEKCPVCRKQLIFEITINNLTLNSVFDNLSPNFNKNFPSASPYHSPASPYHSRKMNGYIVPPNQKEKVDPGMIRKTRKHKSLVPFSFKKEGITVDLKKGMITFYNNFDPTFNFFYRASCPHELLKDEYAIWGELLVNMSQFTVGKIIQLALPIVEIAIDYEQFNLINVRLDKNQGSKISILNNYHGDGTTAFGMSEIDLATGKGLYKEKKVDLVEDDFFKFHEANKVQTRINSMFML